MIFIVKTFQWGNCRKPACTILFDWVISGALEWFTKLARFLKELREFVDRRFAETVVSRGPGAREDKNMTRRAIVTGASRGIGKAIARRLAEEGWDIVNLDMGEPSEDAVGQWVAADLADPDSLETALAEILKDGPVSGLVNNAGIGTSSLLEETTDEDFDRIVAVNMRAPMICARAVVPGMKAEGFGRIVNISSRAHLGKTHRTAYSASKGGILSMGRVWALEMAGNGITVNTIAPGPIRTELFERVNPPGMPRTQEIIDSMPVGRLGEPADIANAVAFYMDDRSSFVTGQTLYVCGGITLSRGGN
jgi:3-oxoacyl-[acyl-carrier protein] reductase